MAPPSLMVLNGEARAALGVVRNLGRKGVPVYVGGNERWAMASRSRHARRRFAYPPLATDPERTHAAVMERIRQWRPNVLLPVSDEGWELVYSHFDEYRRAVRVVPCPGPDLFRLSFDKGSMYELAARHGVPAPLTLQPRSLEEALDQARELPYPLLLKPRKGRAGEGIRRVESRPELETALAEFNSGVPLLQEFIEGQDLDLTLLTVEGRLLAASAYKGIRNYPLPYGPPVACRTIDDAELVETGGAFLQSLRYTGVAHLDFRRDRHDGKTKLLDFNARLAGTDEISTRSGVDFAHLLYRLALGEDLTVGVQGQAGVEYRHLMFGELLHLLRTPRKRETLAALLRPRGAASNLSLSDPIPHAAQLLSGLLRRMG